MIVVKIFAGIIIFLTVALAVLGQFFELYNPAQEQIVSDGTHDTAVVETVQDVRRHPGGVNCKFEPVTDSPQQFAADYLFAELWRQGDRHTFSARLAVPTSGYTVRFSPLSIAGTQAIVTADLVKPSGATLDMIDSIPMQHTMRLPDQALTLRVVLRRNFAWGPDAIICSVMRPASATSPQAVPATP